MEYLKEQVKRKPSICFVAHNAYGAMTGWDAGGHIGGAECQTTLMARWLASKGYEIYLLTWDEGQPPEIEISGVRVIKMCPRDSGIPVIRFFYPRIYSLYSTVKKINADVYYHNSAEYVTGILAAWCKINKKKFIYSVASDVACEKKLPAMHKIYEKNLYKYGLRNASRIIVQTEYQKKLLKDDFNLPSYKLFMPCEDYSNTVKQSLVNDETNILWVGRIAHMKRLEILLDVAELLPEVSFTVAAAITDATQYVDELFYRAEKLTNVDWHSNVPRSKLPLLYSNSSALCCTSSYEGFPNTFMEAWSHGKAVITTFDPDGLIERLELGVVAEDISELVEAILSIKSTPDQWKAKCSNSKCHYNKYHKVDNAMRHFENQFLDICEI